MSKYYIDYDYDILFITAMAFVVGSFIQVRMVLFLRSSKIRKTDIDELILLEQEQIISKPVSFLD